MAETVIPPPPLVTVPVAGGGAFPVRRIFCVGRNYAAHAREMGHDPDREPPFFFTKPADALVTGGADTPYPPQTDDLHHEMEQVVAIGRGGADIAAGDALAHVWGYAAGLDLTRRDLQAEAKKLGRPWDMAKGFDHSAPIGTLVPAEGVNPGRGVIELRVNGQIRQRSDLGQLIWSVPEVVAYLSFFFIVSACYVIFTGTPSGVGMGRTPPIWLADGDILTSHIEGIGEMRHRFVAGPPRIA